MATILIAEDDELLARQMAHTLRTAGHDPLLARDARTALREARACPDGILLDLELPDLSFDEMLRQLDYNSGSAHLPVLIVIGHREAAARLKAAGRVAGALRKPVSGLQLRESFSTLPATERSPDSQLLRLDHQRQRQLILHLIVKRRCRPQGRYAHLPVGSGKEPDWLEYRTRIAARGPEGHA